MKKVAYPIVLSLLLTAAFLAGSLYNEHAAASKNSTDGRTPLYYVDPMHPAYKSHQPGIAPDCGMQLEPVYGEAAARSTEAAPPGTLTIGAEKQQRIGVQVSAVEKAPATHRLRLFGRVAPDETRVYKLIAGLDGMVREISNVTTGSQVAKDEWLATFSAPDLRPPIQGFLVTLDVADRQKQAGADAPVQVKAAAQSMQLAVDRLLNLGMSAVQVEEIRRSREVPTAIRILAPAAGFVLSRNVSPGQRFEKGAEWYRIADLSRVWVVADAFRQDEKYIRAGQSARVTVAGEDKVFAATISDVQPQFDANSRTLKVRLELRNPGYALRPDMFVDVEVPVSLPPAIWVPADAVLDSGLRRTVFVDRGEGVFEPRPVQTGWRLGGRVEIVKGLEPGDRIVTAGSFLLDSESRLVQAAASLGQKQQAKDPACGMNMDAAKARYMSERGGRRYFFCSAQCKRQFDNAPERYLHKEM